MPKIPVDYSKTIIYKIEHIDDDSLVYVGHTTNWDNRKYMHKFNCINNKSSHYNCKLYQMIRENGGWDAFKMIEVEKFNCNDKREAETRENEVIKKLKASMNTNKSYVSKEEEKQDNQDYYIKNKERIIEQHKEYKKKNREKIRASFREKLKCDCGCEITQYHLKRHQQSIKRIDLMKKL